MLGFHAYPGNVEDVVGSLARLRAEPSDVLVLGLADGTIDAYEWTEAERHALLDHAWSQLRDAA